MSLVWTFHRKSNRSQTKDIHPHYPCQYHHDNPSSGCWDISVWTKADWPNDKHRVALLAWVKIKLNHARSPDGKSMKDLNLHSPRLKISCLRGQNWTWRTLKLHQWCNANNGRKRTKTSTDDWVDQNRWFTVRQINSLCQLIYHHLQGMCACLSRMKLSDEWKVCEMKKVLFYLIFCHFLQCCKDSLYNTWLLITIRNKTTKDDKKRMRRRGRQNATNPPKMKRIRKNNTYSTRSLLQVWQVLSGPEPPQSLRLPSPCLYWENQTNNLV